MTSTLQELTKRVWELETGRDFTPGLLLKRLKMDGGLDAGGLCSELIDELLGEESIRNWHPAIFSCSEITAYYVAVDQRISKEQVVGAAFAMCVLADGARQGECDWSIEHDKVIRLCSLLSEKASFESVIETMRYVFGKGGESPFDPEKVKAL